MIAIDGDGSVLTNFGTLPTIANNVADNFILLIIDNGITDQLEISPLMQVAKPLLLKLQKHAAVRMLLNAKHQKQRKF